MVFLLIPIAVRWREYLPTAFPLFPPRVIQDSIDIEVECFSERLLDSPDFLNDFVP